MQQFAICECVVHDRTQIQRRYFGTIIYSSFREFLLLSTAGVKRLGEKD